MGSREFFSLLQSCIPSKSLRLWKQIHQKIVTLGSQDHVALCKGLMNFYICCHEPASAKYVFLILDNTHDITLWNGLIAAFTKNYMYNETLEIFERLLHLSYPSPDSYTYPSVLKACGALGRVDCGKVIHSQLIKHGLLSDFVVASCVVGMYAKCDMFGSATQVFDEMTERDVACWNTVISCYYQSGEYAKALEFFEMMKESGFMPDSVSYTTAIASCARTLDLERGKKIHKELISNGFGRDAFTSAALVDMYGKCGSIETAKVIFDQIPWKSLVSWNALIGGYSIIGDSRSCIELFLRMVDEKIRPTSVTFSSLLIACSKSAQLLHGKFIHGFLLRNNIEMDLYIGTALIDFYFKSGYAKQAETIFNNMPKDNVVVWNVVISGYVAIGDYTQALEVFNLMKEVGMKPDTITLTSALSSCSELAALEQGKDIHRYILDSKLKVTEVVMGALLDMYAKCGAIEEAVAIFNELPERDLLSWTTMLVAYGSNGQALEALSLFNKMLKSNVIPDRVAFRAVISACSHAGLIDKGCYYFNLMVSDFGMQPAVEDYSCLIDLLGRAGRLHEAFGIIQRNPCMWEDVGLLSTLMAACSRHREVEIGEQIADLLLNKDPDCQSTYVALARMYASVNNWDEARKVRVKMNMLGLRKKPGCSWIEVDKRTLAFLSEDKLFPLAESVFNCLTMIFNHVENDEVVLGLI